MTLMNIIIKSRQSSLILAVVLLTAGSSFAADVYLVAKEFTQTLTLPDGAPSPSITMWGFAEDQDSDLTTDDNEAASVPGPRITVPVGDTTLNIHLRNDLINASVSVVIPGQYAPITPVKFTDGQGRERARSFTAETFPNGGISTYSWNNLKPGTYLYHSGTHPAVQVQMGLYGAVTLDAASAPSAQAYPGVSYDNEALLLYSEIDPSLHEAVASSAYGTSAYPSTINYKAKYFLINGAPFEQAQTAIPAGHTNETLLLRFLNAGLMTHAPILLGAYMNIVSEDGNLYPYPETKYSAFLPAGKTLDAVLIPTEAATYALYDRRLYLSSNNQAGGGMLAHLQIADVAGAPVAVADAYTVDEDQPLNVAPAGVLSNDTGASAAVLVSDAGAGTLTLNGDGSFDYMPNLNFNGVDIFTYQASDGVLNSNVASVQITVNAVNDPPIAVDDGIETIEGTAIDIPILANDIDVDGDPLTVFSFTQGANGTVDNIGGIVTYTPVSGFTGVDSFTYVATDGTVNSNVGTVTITINPRINASPIAVDDYANVLRYSGNNPPTSVTINVAGNDSDSDGSIAPGSVVIITQPTRGGTVLNNLDGTVTFTPKKAFSGTDVFTYTVNDNEGAVSNEATVRVNVIKP